MFSKTAQQQTLKPHYYFKAIRDNWIKIPLSLTIYSPTTVLYCVKFQASVSVGLDSSKHNGQERVDADRHPCLRSTAAGGEAVSFWRLVSPVKTLLQIFSLCAFYMLASIYLFTFPWDHCLASQSSLKNRREIRVAGRLAYFSVVIWAFLCKKST